MGATRDARACLAEGIPENGVSVKTSWLVWSGVSVKTFSAHVVVIFDLPCVENDLVRTRGSGKIGNSEKNRGNKLKRGRCGIAGSSLGSYFTLA